MTSSPFHAGEEAVQERVGVRARVATYAPQMIRSYMPDQHRQFFENLPFMIAAARDKRGRPWATVLSGKPGFVQSISPTHMDIGHLPGDGDALADAFQVGAEIGLLGIELHSRRRNRVNGHIEHMDNGGFRFATSQSFGNCPQYITQRSWTWLSDRNRTVKSHRSHGLDAEAKRRIAQADTFFIASGYNDGGKDKPHNGMDASHRGGEPGFVEITGEHELRFPDYAGNNVFNTLGNLLKDPRVGLLFIDFESGALLQLTGRAEIDWDSAEVERRAQAHRLITVKIDEVIRLENTLPIRWAAPAESHQLLRVKQRKAESANITSFILQSLNGEKLRSFKPGQHLPVELEVKGRSAPVARTYSISSGRNDAEYRISVKRESKGLMSRLLHDAVQTGDTLKVGNPAGDFTLDESDSAVVMISAGVGITPMMSMLHDLVDSASDRPVFFFHGARNGEEHAFAGEVEDLQQRAPTIIRHIAYSQPTPADVVRRRFDTTGRITPELIAAIHPGLSGAFYLCGPEAFVHQITTGLQQLGVDADRIHYETFGSAGAQSNER